MLIWIIFSVVSTGTISGPVSWRLPILSPTESVTGICDHTTPQRLPPYILVMIAVIGSEYSIKGYGIPIPSGNLSHNAGASLPSVWIVLSLESHLSVGGDYRPFLIFYVGWYGATLRIETGIGSVYGAVWCVACESVHILMLGTKGPGVGSGERRPARVGGRWDRGVGGGC
ncbi:hypothetical protein Tco_0038444 [Tanacetum coccineum]